MNERFYNAIFLFLEKGASWEYLEKRIKELYPQHLVEFYSIKSGYLNRVFNA